MKHVLSKKQRGTTLIEIILYIAISGFVLVDTTSIIVQVVYNQTKVETIAREDETARTLLRLLSQSIQEATTLNTPNSINATTTTLNFTDTNANIVNYSTTNGILYRSINSGTSIAMSTSDIYIKNLSFTVESEAGVSPSINIKLDIEKSSSNATTLTHYETTAAQRKL